MSADRELLLARIAEAIALTLEEDGRCWADRGDDTHRAASCLLCHVRGVLVGDPPPTEGESDVGQQVVDAFHAVYGGPGGLERLAKAVDEEA